MNNAQGTLAASNLQSVISTKLRGLLGSVMNGGSSSIGGGVIGGNISTQPNIIMNQGPILLEE